MNSLAKLTPQNTFWFWILLLLQYTRYSHVVDQTMFPSQLFRVIICLNAERSGFPIVNTCTLLQLSLTSPFVVSFQLWKLKEKFFQMLLSLSWTSNRNPNLKRSVISKIQIVNFYMEKPNPKIPDCIWSNNPNINMNLVSCPYSRLQLDGQTKFKSRLWHLIPTHESLF
jgi:hypothetical protein